MEDHHFTRDVNLLFRLDRQHCCNSVRSLPFPHHAFCRADCRADLSSFRIFGQPCGRGALYSRIRISAVQCLFASRKPCCKRIGHNSGTVFRLIEDGLFLGGILRERCSELRTIIRSIQKWCGPLLSGTLKLPRLFFAVHQKFIDAALGTSYAASLQNTPLFLKREILRRPALPGFGGERGRHRKRPSLSSKHSAFLGKE